MRLTNHIGKVLILLAAIIIVVSFVAIFFVRDSSYESRNGTVDIILFSGQSNMVGYGEKPSTCKIKNGDGYEYFGNTDELGNIKDPVGERTGRDDKDIYKGSMIPSFVYHYLKNTDNNVIAVPSAYGASSIDDWQPGGENLTSTIDKYNAAVSYIKDNTDYKIDKAICVWLQGETDILKEISGDEYKEKFLNMHDELVSKTDINQCIMIPIGSRRDAPMECAEEINKAQFELIDENTDILCGSTNAMKFSKDKTMLKSDVLHFNTKALELLGKESALRYFSEQR